MEPGRWDDADPRTHKVCRQANQPVNLKTDNRVLQVSLDPYRRESSKIIAIFKSMVAEGEVGKSRVKDPSLAQSYLTLACICI